MLEFYFNQIFKKAELDLYKKKEESYNEIDLECRCFEKLFIIKDEIANNENNPKEDIKYYKIIDKYWDKYGLIILDKGILFDPLKINKLLYEQNKLGLINQNCFDKNISFSLLRFFCRQIILGLEIINSNFFVIYDELFKNKLITNDIIFNLFKSGNDRGINLTRIKTVEEEFKFYKKAKKREHFALLLILIKLKYGKSFYENTIDEKNIIESLFKVIDYLKKTKLFDKNFIDFLNKLMITYSKDEYDPKIIIRNKWLHNDSEYTEKIINDYDDIDNNNDIDNNVNNNKNNNDNNKNNVNNNKNNKNNNKNNKNNNKNNNDNNKNNNDKNNDNKNNDNINDNNKNNNNDDDENKVKILKELQKLDFLIQKKEIFENNNKRELNEINMNKPKKRNTRKNFNFKKKVKLNIY